MMAVQLFTRIIKFLPDLFVSSFSVCHSDYFSPDQVFGLFFLWRERTIFKELSKLFASDFVSHGWPLTWLELSLLV